MTGAGEGAATAAKFLAVLKELPLWLLTGLTISAAALLFGPGIASVVPLAARPWIIIGGVCSAGLAFARALGLLIERVTQWRQSKTARRKFHITAVPQQSFLHFAKQPDDSIVTQVSAKFLVKNLTDDPLALASARLLRPRVRGEVLNCDVSMRAADRNIYGDAYSSGHAIPPRMSLPASAHIMIRGMPWCEPKDQVRATIAIRDDEGQEQRVRMMMHVMPRAQAVAALPALEIVSSLSDPIERKVASVLQAELARYDKNGRSSGGLGSVHLVVSGHEMTSFGGDGWIPNSPKNPSLYDKPDEVELRSDNLEALILRCPDRKTTPVYSMTHESSQVPDHGI